MIPLFVLAHFGHHLLTALPTPLLPLIRSEFGLDYAQSGLVVSAFGIAYGVGQLPAGWLGDRLGPKILITAGIVGVAVAGLLVGLSQTYLMMIVLLVLMGLAGGGYHPSAAPLISASVDPKMQGRALGLHMIGGSGSFFLAPLIAAAIAAAWGWRGSFIGLAVPTAVFGIAFYILLGRLAVGKQAQAVAATSSTPAPRTRGRVRRVAAILVMSIVTQAILSSVTAFIPLYLVDHFGVAEGTAAALLSITYSAGLWAGVMGGYISDRVGRVPILVVTCLLVAPVIYLLTIAPYGIGIWAVLLAGGIIMYIRMPVAEAFLFGEVGAKTRSTIFGVYYFTNMEAGAVLTPLFGSLIDRFGFETNFTFAAIAVVVVVLICAVFLWGSRSRQPASAT